MKQFVEIPTVPSAQTLNVQLAGVMWKLQITWNESMGHWTISFLTIEEVPVLMGIPLVTGVDLLGQHQHLGFGGSLIAQSDGDPDQPPTFDSLGISSRIYFVTEAS